jgi:aminopeptidase N
VWNRFDETPLMSPYLVAFFVGWLESRETQTTNGTPFRVWARPEVMTQTQYALDIGPRVLDFFSSLLGVSEPLPKQDVLALPHFVADALENWGLISFGSVSQQLPFPLHRQFSLFPNNI